MQGTICEKKKIQELFARQWGKRCFWSQRKACRGKNGDIWNYFPNFTPYWIHPKHETPFFGISFYLEAFLFIWNKNAYPYITALIEWKLNICIHTSVKMSFWIYKMYVYSVTYNTYIHITHPLRRWELSWYDSPIQSWVESLLPGSLVSKIWMITSHVKKPYWLLMAQSRKLWFGYSPSWWLLFVAC